MPRGEPEYELYRAREVILEMLSTPLRQAAERYYHCATWADYGEWRRALAQRVLENAQLLGREEDPYDPPRAYCPLCECGSQWDYAPGFTLPTGMLRHLTGSGNAHQCSVFEQIELLAMSRKLDLFRQHREDECAAKAAALDERRATETQYRVDALQAPLLRDEELERDTAPRDDASLAWAETRLAALGFERTEADGVIAHTRQAGAYLVYADPRHAKKLSFSLRAVRGPKGGLLRKGREPRRETFEMQDRLKNNLSGQYEALLARAVESLERRPYYLR